MQPTQISGSLQIFEHRINNRIVRQQVMEQTHSKNNKTLFINPKTEFKMHKLIVFT